MQRRPFFVLPSFGALALTLTFVFSAPPAQAQQDVSALLDRMERLERDINILQRQLYRSGLDLSAQPSGGAPAAGVSGGALPTDAASRLQLRLNELERLVTGLTGKVEESIFRSRQLGERLERMQADTDFRFKELTGEAGVPTAQTGPGGVGTLQQPTGPVGGAGRPAVVLRPGAPVTPSDMGASQLGLKNDQVPPSVGAQQAAQTAPQSAKLPDGTVDEQYRFAFSLLQQGRYSMAEQALTEFVEKHGESRLAGNAQYWLGETFYVRQDYGQAARTFLEGFQKYPKSPKAPDNLLKLGLAMSNLGQQKEACSAFTKIGKDYPSAPDLIKRKAAAYSQDNGC